MTIDLLPTIAALAGAKLPERTIDGKDISPLLSGKDGVKSPHEALYFYWGQALEGVRSGKWKLHLPHEYRSLRDKPGADGQPGPYVQRKIELALFDLAADVGEQKDVAAEHPEIVERLKGFAERARDDLGDSATGRKGKNVRAPGRVE
jgi:arylsulfatase A-like enzyme